MAKLGFIGLGIMGAPMAGHLQAGGHKLYLHDVKNPPASLVEGGATVCTSAMEVAKRADIIFLMVPDTPQVEEVLFSEDGIAAGLSAGKIVVDMSSISPIATKEFAKKINKKSCAYLDAPVSGGEVGAKAASLTIMVGGPQEAFDTVKPLFDLMGKNITLVGGNGDGQTTKVANQIIVALNIQAVAEALLFASKAGADGFNLDDTDWADIDCRRGTIVVSRAGVLESGMDYFTAASAFPMVFAAQDGDPTTGQYPTVEVTAGTMTVMYWTVMA